MSYAVLSFQTGRDGTMHAAYLSGFEVSRKGGQHKALALWARRPSAALEFADVKKANVVADLVKTWCGQSVVDVVEVSA